MENNYNSVEKQQVKGHAVCIPFPAQGHVKPMMKLAKILHHNGFHITFVNSEFNHNRLLRSRGSNSLDGLPSFRFAAIPDGLPPTDAVDATQDIPSLFKSTTTTCLAPFMDLIRELNHRAATSGGVPPVSCIVSDAAMGFTVDAAEEVGVPKVLLWTASTSGFMGYAQYGSLVEKGLIPLKDASDHTNGYLETIIDWIPCMKGIRLKDFPTFIRTTDPNDFMVNICKDELDRARKASAIIFNTFQELEGDICDALSSTFPPIIPIGPLNLIMNQILEDNNDLKMIGSNLWKEEPECLQWLDSQEPNSVVYVNFGSITVMTPAQLVEFAWGLANTNLTFLWIIRPDLVAGESAILPPEFVTDTQNRGMLAGWCPQEQVLNHPSIGGFLTHNGWNSTLESISSGVPMICWPFFAEQQTNCWFCCTHWGIGMEIDSDVKREKVESLVRELMIGDKGKEMKKKTLEWKRLAQESATAPTGSSYLNIEKLIKHLTPEHLIN